MSKVLKVKCFSVSSGETTDEVMEKLISAWLNKAMITPEQIVNIVQSGSEYRFLATIYYT